jgi:hypothetical protein
MAVSGAGGFRAADDHTVFVGAVRGADRIFTDIFAALFSVVSDAWFFSL